MFNWLHFNHDWAYIKDIYTKKTDIKVRLCDKHFCNNIKVTAKRKGNRYGEFEVIKAEFVPKHIEQAKVTLMENKSVWMTESKSDLD